MKNLLPRPSRWPSPPCSAACSPDQPPVEAPRPVRTVELRYDAAREANRYAGTVQSRHRGRPGLPRRRQGRAAQGRRRPVRARGRRAGRAGRRRLPARRGRRAAAMAAAAVTQARQAESDRKRLGALKSDGSVSVADDERAHTGAQTAQASRRGRGAPARARAQPPEVHGAARLAQRRGHRGALRGRARSSPKACRSSPSPTPATPEIVVDVPEDQLAAFQKAQLQGHRWRARRTSLRRGAARAVAAGRRADAHLPRAAEADRRPAAAAGRDRHAGGRPRDRRTCRWPPSRPPRSPRPTASRRVWVVKHAGPGAGGHRGTDAAWRCTATATTTCWSPACRPASRSSPPGCRRWRPD